LVGWQKGTEDTILAIHIHATGSSEEIQTDTKGAHLAGRKAKLTWIYLYFFLSETSSISMFTEFMYGSDVWVVSYEK